MKLYAHPFSSYSQKVQIALYENATPFEYRVLDTPDGDAARELAALWPLKRFPVLVDGDRTVLEATAIIEHLAARYPGPVALIPSDTDAAVDVRMMDRVFDNYISTPLQKLVFDSLRPEPDRDTYGTAEARRMLDTTYAWLDARMGGREWASGDTFTLADCSAAPALFYADWAHPFGDAYPNLSAYRRRLLVRPSVARAVEEGRPFRAYFPLGAPDRD